MEKMKMDRKNYGDHILKKLQIKQSMPPKLLTRLYLPMQPIVNHGVNVLSRNF